MLRDSGASLLFDHCCRPDPRAGLDQAGFAALPGLGDSGRAPRGVVGDAAAAVRVRGVSDSGRRRDAVPGDVVGEQSIIGEVGK